MFSYVSLFSGIGGFEHGLNKLGGSCVLSSEIDNFANKSYEALFGEPTVGDITKVPEHLVPEHDLLVGGFPCQAFSIAGKRGGFDDARGTLFFEAARIIAKKQPKVILLENVKGLVGHDKGKTLATMAKTLAEIGYTIDFQVLNTKYVLPQHRERIFIVGIRNDLIEHRDWVATGSSIVAKRKRELLGYGDLKTFDFDWSLPTFMDLRIRDVMESEVDPKYYRTDDKAKAFVEKLDQGVLRIPESLPEIQVVGLLGEGYRQINEVLSPNGICTTLRTFQGGGLHPKIVEYIDGRPYVRRLTPLECFRLQGFPSESHQKLVGAGLSDTQLYKQIGNSVSVPLIEIIGSRLLQFLS
jgi:DNA (cytosine-5)-methyltransferase 1